MTITEKELVPVAWAGYWPGAGSEDSVTRTTRSKRNADSWAEVGATVTALTELDIAAAALSEERKRADAAETELERLRAAIAAKGGTEHAPTQEAYALACAAIDKHRVRADAAEATVGRLRAALEPFASRAETYDPDEGDGDQEGLADRPLIKEYRAARAARSSGEH